MQSERPARTIRISITALTAFQKAERVMVYADYNREVVTRYIIEEAWKQGKTCSSA